MLTSVQFPWSSLKELYLTSVLVSKTEHSYKSIPFAFAPIYIYIHIVTSLPAETSGFVPGSIHCCPCFGVFNFGRLGVQQ